MPHILLTECVDRHLYRICSRNLTYGVFNGETGFVGIREKFGNKHLFTEFHYDTGEPYGTVSPQKDLGEIPDGIDVCEHEPTISERTGRRVEFDTPVSSGGRGWYDVETGESVKDCHPVARMYRPLFDYLKQVEEECDDS